MDISPKKRVFYCCPLSIANPELQPGIEAWLSVTISHKGKEIQSLGASSLSKRPDFVASCWCSLADKNCNVLRNKFEKQISRFLQICWFNPSKLRGRVCHWCQCNGLSLSGIGVTKAHFDVGQNRRCHWHAEFQTCYYSRAVHRCAAVAAK